MTDVYLSLGSNIDPETNIIRAVIELKKSLRIRKISTVYLTAALSGQSQPDFYNCVLLAETDSSPRELKYGLLRKIESLLGRKRVGDRYAPRTIDIDILIFGTDEMDEEGIEIPDPDIFSRPFLARGLLELSPGLILPGGNTALAEVAEELDNASMKPLENFTERVRKLIA